MARPITGRFCLPSLPARGAERFAAFGGRNVDFDRGAVHIVESAKQTAKGVVRGATKGGYRRPVTLPASTLDELQRWKCEQAEQLLRLGVRQTQDTCVCTQPDGTPISPNILTNFFARLAKRLGLPVHFHSLRHTHATTLLLAGVHPKVAQERLGHSSVAITMDVYSHVTERLQNDAAAKVDAMLKHSGSK